MKPLPRFSTAEIQFFLIYIAIFNCYLFTRRENPLTLAGEKGHVELVSLLLSRLVKVAVVFNHIDYSCWKIFRAIVKQLLLFVNTGSKKWKFRRNLKGVSWIICRQLICYSNNMMWTSKESQFSALFVKRVWRILPHLSCALWSIKKICCKL